MVTQKGFAIIAVILLSSLVGTLFMLGGEEIVREIHIHQNPVSPQIFTHDVVTPVPLFTPFRSPEWK